MEADPEADGSAGPLVARHSRRFSDALVEEARVLFQADSARPLNNEDARQMLENLTGFFIVLMEWDRASAARETVCDNMGTKREFHG